LAGTKLFSDAVEWTPKEITEQKIVTDYIVSNISSRVNNLAVSEPKTVQAGNLAHLKSVITGQLTTDFSALDLITTLHPTPAICGLPKELATEFILANEQYHRSYYAGFLGEFNSQNTTDLFVNLRCMQWEEQAVTIYVGCGITADSDPQLEYIETVNKSMTMRNVLVEIKK
jgi:isochorismate synthase